MNVSNGNISKLISEYVKANPKGRDVTAHVLNGLGKVDVKKYATAAHKGDMDPTKQEIGGLVRDAVFEKFPASKKLREVKVDKKAWPELAEWVSSYMTYDIK